MQGPAPWALLDLVLSKGDIAHWSRYTGHCPVPWACHACLCLKAFVLAGWLCLEFTVDPSSPPGPCLRIILSASLTSIFKHYKLPSSFLHFSSLSCFVLSIALIPWRIITLISYFVYCLGEVFHKGRERLSFLLTVLVLIAWNGWMNWTVNCEGTYLSLRGSGLASIDSWRVAAAETQAVLP